jgi:hypothetical protein
MLALPIKEFHMHPSRIALALLLVGGFAPAQSPAVPAAADKVPTAGQVMERQLANLERAFVSAAESMPEHKFAYAHKAFAGINDSNAAASIPAAWGKGTATRLGLATLTVAHGFDHYGQMAVYLRMNGIIPPASRKP